MSAVINRAKQRYIKAIKWEMAIIFFEFPCSDCRAIRA